MSCCGKKPRPYTPVQQAAELTATLGRTAFAFVTGKPVFSDEELIKARLKICGECGYYSPLGNKCNICKCPDFRLKLRLRESRCPIEEW